MLLDKSGAALITYPSAGGSITLVSITNVGNYAFDGCTALKTVKLSRRYTSARGPSVTVKPWKR
jgi:hypothetical protein